MTDIFSSQQSSLQSPATNIYPAVPNDGSDLSISSRALNVSSSGAVRVTTVAGDEATVFIAAGTAFPIRVRRIWSTGTTATDIMVLF